MKYNTILKIVLFSIFIAFIIFILIPKDINVNINTDLPVVNLDINNQINKLTDNAQAQLINTIPKPIVEKIIDNAPKDIIVEKCIRLQQPVSLNKYDEIITDDLPVDDKVDMCKISGGYLDDIEIDKVVFPAEPKIILY